MPPETVGSVILALRRRFAEAGIETAALDARVLAMHVLALDHVALVADPDRPVSAQEAAALDAVARRRLAGETVSRIIGRREFYGRAFRVTGDTLDPRADTEALIEAALASCRDRPPERILDLGTGTGILAVTLLLAFPAATAVACDISEAALAVAKANATAHGVGDRLQLVRSDWWAQIEGRFDLIVSNPPYIPSTAIAALAPEVRHGDPLVALDGGPDGLDAYRTLATGTAAHLAEGGVLLVEIGDRQADDIVGVFACSGFCLAGGDAGRTTDLAGRVRVLAFAAMAPGQGTARVKKQLE
jgi:release factor glutamine methyltransferase